MHGDRRVDDEERRYLRDVQDHAMRIQEQAAAFRELLQNILSVNLTLETKALSETSNAQNEEVKKISAWAAILFAPSIVGTIYGMNFRHMPELRLAPRLPVRPRADGARRAGALRAVQAPRLDLAPRRIRIRDPCPASLPTRRVVGVRRGGRGRDGVDLPAEDRLRRSRRSAWCISSEWWSCPRSGAAARCGDIDRECRRLQLLPSGADRALHDRGTSRNWVALVTASVVIALTTSAVSEQARSRAREAERRRGRGRWRMPRWRSGCWRPRTSTRPWRWSRGISPERSNSRRWRS